MMADNPRLQCFASIQSRKLLGSLESCQLCPAMDLVMFGTSTSKQQSLYRTVSWQKVASVSASSSSSSESTHCTSSWSPNGRWIAVACDSQVSLYGVEALANPTGGFAPASASASSEAQHSWTVANPIVGLTWMHVGRPHPTAWKLTEDELEEEVSWSYQSEYVDRSTDFLPPSAYHQKPEDDDHHAHHDTNTTTTGLPECQTPLSVLCVSTTHHLELYLHGRYPLLKLPCSQTAPPQIVASSDLRHFLVYSEPRMSLYHFPFLKEDRYPLQMIASLHSSIISHLATLQQSIPEVLNSWKSSLKPLDTKIQPLSRLLQNYGVDDQPLGAILKQYILVGHTSDSSSVANAMDQFFTSVQMNDQLLQRMERSLHGSLANVESLARKGLLSPTQALVLQVQELAGIVQYHATSATSDLQKLVESGHHLWVSVEALLTSIIECRFRVRDLCGWLRSAGSQTKARGTAAQSVQRENAKKRRVPQAVLERLLAVLNTTSLPDKQTGLTEHVLHMTVSDMLKEDMPSFISKSKSHRPSSPASVVRFFHSTPTVTYATRKTLNACNAVFANPLSSIPQSVVPKELVLPQSTALNETSVAVHTRIGRDAMLDEPDEDEREEEPTYFLPRIAKHPYDNLPDCLDCRQWSIIAQAQKSIVQLFCLPLGWKESSEEGYLEEGEVEDIPFYLTAKLVFPSSGLIKEVGFYGDDGKSSLSSGNDSGSGKEGRQKIGILFQEEKIELWLTPYDSLLWQAVPFESIFMEASQVDQQCTKMVQAIPEISKEDEEMLDTEVLWAQTRVITELESTHNTSKLLLCGSRGVGGVAVTSQGITSFELLDLEEDEEADEEEEEEDFDEEE